MRRATLFLFAAVFLFAAQAQAARPVATPPVAAPPVATPPVAPPVATPPVAAPPLPVPGQLIVYTKNNEAAEKLHKGLGAEVLDRNSALGFDVVRVPQGQEAALLQRYRKSDFVQGAEQDTTVSLLTNDPGWSRQWGLHNASTTIQPDRSFVLDADIDAPEAWALASPAEARVAILDTGIDQDHADLRGKIVLQRNFSNSRTLDDAQGHGTHVAGTVAAIADNSIGVAGVAPNAVLLNGKVLGDNGSGTCSGVASGISWAADAGAKVISMSIGGGACTAQNNAVQYAWSKGSLPVAAAGNSASSAPSYPAAYEPTVAVAASDNSDLLASFSNFGSWVDIAAPGENIYATMTNHKSSLSRSVSYGYLSGTSMATPIVSGAAAFLQLADANGNGRTNDEIRARLLSSSDKPSAISTKISGGRLNLCRALTNGGSC